MGSDSVVELEVQCQCGGSTCEAKQYCWKDETCHDVPRYYTYGQRLYLYNPTVGYHQPVCGADYNTNTNVILDVCKSIGGTEATIIESNLDYKMDAIYVGSCEEGQFPDNCDKSNSAEVDCSSGQTVGFKFDCTAPDAPQCETAALTKLVMGFGAAAQGGDAKAGKC